MKNQEIRITWTVGGNAWDVAKPLGLHPRTIEELEKIVAGSSLIRITFAIWDADGGHCVGYHISGAPDSIDRSHIVRIGNHYYAINGNTVFVYRCYTSVEFFEETEPESVFEFAKAPTEFELYRASCMLHKLDEFALEHLNEYVMHTHTDEYGNEYHHMMFWAKTPLIWQNLRIAEADGSGCKTIAGLPVYTVEDFHTDYRFVVVNPEYPDGFSVSRKTLDSGVIDVRMHPENAVFRYLSFAIPYAKSIHADTIYIVENRNAYNIQADELLADFQQNKRNFKNADMLTALCVSDENAVTAELQKHGELDPKPIDALSMQLSHDDEEEDGERLPPLEFTGRFVRDGDYLHREMTGGPEDDEIIADDEIYGWFTN